MFWDAKSDSRVLMKNRRIPIIDPDAMRRGITRDYRSLRSRFERSSD